MKLPKIKMPKFSMPKLNIGEKVGKATDKVKGALIWEASWGVFADLKTVLNRVCTLSMPHQLFLTCFPPGRIILRFLML
jgi:hypothetical protein